MTDGTGGIQSNHAAIAEYIQECKRIDELVRILKEIRAATTTQQVKELIRQMLRFT